MRVYQAYLSTEQSSVANYKFTLIAITRETIKLYFTQHCAADFVPNFYRGLYIPPRLGFITPIYIYIYIYIYGPPSFFFLIFSFYFCKTKNKKKNKTTSRAKESAKKGGLTNNTFYFIISL